MRQAEFIQLTRQRGLRVLPGKRALFCIALLILLFASACEEIGKPEANSLYAEAKPPVRQEFRWSNGKAPKTLDPAKASAAPETDVVRALYEGLTELDPKSLKEIPAAAEKWESSDDFKHWTFYIRNDAKWSNGEPLTAEDFVRSWRRAAALGNASAYPLLFQNIVGLRELGEAVPVVETASTDQVKSALPGGELPAGKMTDKPTDSQPDQEPGGSGPVVEKSVTTGSDLIDKALEKSSPGVIAEGPKLLKVNLINPDEEFPKLVAHPVFRPVYAHGKENGDRLSDSETVTNGAFRLLSLGPAGLTLERSEEYWNRDAVKLERVQFVPAENAEEALDAYRSGKVDAVTNAEFSPLALKLLSPFEDFQSTAFSALNLYEINYEKPHFNDRRIRLALAISIERERLTEGELEGSTQPASRFLPFGPDPSAALVQDPEKARELLSEAGFPNGKGFPSIRLLVNRNDAQIRIARLVAKMWKQNLNIEIEIIVMEPGEIEEVRARKDFDIIRRGVVFPTPNEAANLEAIFGSRGSQTAEQETKTPANLSGSGPRHEIVQKPVEKQSATASPADEARRPGPIVTEADALFEMLAIPLYFPSSYSLLKPYVLGFEVNSLDAPLLYGVSIDSAWRPEGAFPGS